MPPRLPAGTRFVKAEDGKHKYIAVIQRSDGGEERSSMDHLDKKRRVAFRARFKGMRCGGSGERCVDVRLSPAWFAYHFLW